MVPASTDLPTLPARMFLDTSYVIARSVLHDQHHAAALSARMRRARTRLATTRAVLIEVANSFARQRYRLVAVSVLRGLEVDRATDIVALTDDRYAAAWELYVSRPDREWGLTDCVSFVVMREFGLTHALTAGRHFAQAGFRALLRPAS